MVKELRDIRLTPARFPATVDAPAPPAPREADATFERMCQSVREIYILCRREFSGKADFGKAGLGRWDGQDSYGTKVQNIWPKVTRHIINLGADPVMYLRAQFALARKDYPPLPNQLLSDNAVSRYERYRDTANEQLERQLKAEAASVKSKVLGLQIGLHWDHLRAVQYALYNLTQVTASPLLRYCLAVEYGLPEVASVFREAALLQYAFQKPFYDRAWQGCIPPQLATDGQRLLDEVLG